MCTHHRFPGGWVTDYQFPFADKKLTEAMGIPGRCVDRVCWMDNTSVMA